MRVDLWFRSLIEVVDYLLRPKGVYKQDFLRVDLWFRSLIEGVDYLLRPKGVYKQDLVWVESMVDRFSDRAVVRGIDYWLSKKMARYV